MLRRSKEGSIETTDKKDTAQELILLCCVLFVSFTFISSHFQDSSLTPPAFSLQLVSDTSLSLTQVPGQKTGLTDFPASLAPFYFQPIPINYCDKELLMSVSGIGPVLADSILKTRKRIGLFKNQHDLLQVSGIGKSRMSKFASSFSFQSK